MALYTKNQFKIIILLYQNGCVNEFKSYGIDKITMGTKLASNTVRNTLKTFVEIGFVKEGMMNWKAKTYYLTDEGIKEYERLLGINLNE